MRIQAQISPLPEHFPKLPGIDLHVQTRQLNQMPDEDQSKLVVGVGGDLIDLYNFDQRHDLERRIHSMVRSKESGGISQKEADTVIEQLALNYQRFGILIADIKSHDIENVIDAQTLHEMFMLGALLEVARNGEITARLIEKINLRFAQSRYFKPTGDMGSSSLFYGEIYASGTPRAGLLRYVLAGEPPPYVYSKEKEGILKQLSDDEAAGRKHYGLLGVQLWEEEPDGKRYDVLSERQKRDRMRASHIDIMGIGDILIKFTDGLDDRGDTENPDIIPFSKARLRDVLHENRERPAKELVYSIFAAAEEYGESKDDTSVLVIKRTA
jgi:serine phosphatase RsbU (regulator of sigma subunit)